MQRTCKIKYIKSIVEDAARIAIKKNADKISEAHLIESLSQHPSSIPREMLEYYEQISQLQKG